MYIQNFKRTEKKYVLNEKEYQMIMTKLEPHIKKDTYYKSTICNIYFDTDHYDLIQTSLEKPLYKEKVRLRSYQIPTLKDEVFLEIKKKYKGIVGKRRIQLKLIDFYHYLESDFDENFDSQIGKELNYTFHYYHLKPKIFIAYDRLSYYSKENKEFRITFDTNIRSRDYNLRLELGDYGKNYFQEKKYIMEIKALDAFPLWFVKILEECQVYPNSFSKYGSIYMKKLEEEIYV